MRRTLVCYSCFSFCKFHFTTISNCLLRNFFCVWFFLENMCWNFLYIDFHRLVRYSCRVIFAKEDKMVWVWYIQYETLFYVCLNFFPQLYESYEWNAASKLILRVVGRYQSTNKITLKSFGNSVEMMMGHQFWLESEFIHKCQGETF